MAPDQTGAYVLRDIASRIAFVQAPSSSFSAQTTYFIGPDPSTAVGFRYDSGQLFGMGSAAYVPYDLVAHRWLRIREAAGIVHLETSPDAGTWNELAAVLDPAWINTESQINIQAGTFQPVAAPGVAEFDDLDVPRCP